MKRSWLELEYESVILWALFSFYKKYITVNETRGVLKNYSSSNIYP